MSIHSFNERVNDFNTANTIVYQWTRKASEALRQQDNERFNECMALVSLWEMHHYTQYHHMRTRILVCWKNFVYHFRKFNNEYYG